MPCDLLIHLTMMPDVLNAWMAHPLDTVPETDTADVEFKTIFAMYRILCILNVGQVESPCDR